MKIKDRAKPKLPPVEPGVYIATCVGVVDLGEQYSEKFKNYRNEVQDVYKRQVGSHVAGDRIFIEQAGQRLHVLTGAFSLWAVVHAVL